MATFPWVRLTLITLAFLTIWVIALCAWLGVSPNALPFFNSATAVPSPAVVAQDPDAAPTAEGPPAASETPGAAAPGAPVTTTLVIGAAAEVVNTGQCLNVRVAPGLGGPAVDCLPDGTKLRITGG